MDDATAARIVDALLDELSDRSFDAAALKYDDPEVYEELHAACVLRVKAAQPEEKSKDA